jgi:putative transposase
VEGPAAGLPGAVALTTAPLLAIGDGSLGFWKALRKVFPTTQDQRCWVHKTANVLDKMAKGVQPKAKAMIHDVWQAETKAAAEKAFDVTVHAVGNRDGVGCCWM